jgi:hypothetical protein
VGEYQCYEFIAVDRPLSAKQMSELRAVSTRAEITATRFWNEYQWGSLKADPATLMERYFDASIYFANWGTHRFMFRVPRARVDEKALREYFVARGAALKSAGEQIVIDLMSDTEEPHYDDDRPSLGTLVPLRAELLRGDLRVAYIAWLLAVQNDDLPDDKREPPVPPGLSELSHALDSLVDFLRIDRDLLAAAAVASQAADGDLDAARKWVASLSGDAKGKWLRRAVDDHDLPLGAQLLRAFRSKRDPTRSAARRTVAELRAAADVQRTKRERLERARDERSRRAAERARTKRLDALSRHVDAAWTELEALVAASGYDKALALAADLRDLATREGAGAEFAARFAEMRKRQLRRRGFFDRWKREA